MIAENFDGSLDKDAVVTACVFHDMGNIIKSDLDRFPDFLEPEGREYWEGVKKEFVERYGVDDHVASEKIAEELGLAPRVMFCLTNIGVSKATETERGDSFERKVCNYADMRVGPYGVLPLEERIADLSKRYAHKAGAIPNDRFEKLVQSLRGIEQQIFSRVGTRPEQITDAAIQETIAELRTLTV